MNITSKLPEVGTTIFTTMSQLAMKHGAINLGQGFPDFSMSQQLIESVHKAMSEGFNQYTHMNGYPLLRERLAEKILNEYATTVSAEEQITITPGGTYAIYTAFSTILNPGDEVIVFEPAYDSYIPNIEINGGVPVLISLQYPDYSIPWNEVKNKISKRTKAIIINSPHNPTGSVLSENDIELLRSIVEGTDIIIISDEVYEHLIFDDKKHLSILRYPDLLQRSFVCFSFGKTYHCTGWKMGYCIADASLMKEFRKVHQFNAFSCNTPMQVALAEHLLNTEEYKNLGKLMQQKRDLFQQLMQQTPFKALPSYGSYFQCYSYAGFSNKKEFDFAVWLTQEYKVATIPLSSFYKSGTDNKIIRFCFAKKEETLINAADRLKNLANC